ncbi:MULTISPECIES: hypothetical protein [Actinosynnema]|uniref:hypothetical protein n=1 Tax=Actinosynnema TaxID=40566 RepID=UPI0020A269AB|nr:hypothetical protein [Actinosynnema pretiosum]MCP2095230.1 hypothetical protein [Actinosynnema pretiosum]
MSRARRQEVAALEGIGRLAVGCPPARPGREPATGEDGARVLIGVGELSGLPG